MDIAGIAGMFEVTATNEGEIMESEPAVRVDPVDPMVSILRDVLGQCARFDCSMFIEHPFNAVSSIELVGTFKVCVHAWWHSIWEQQVGCLVLNTNAI